MGDRTNLLQRCERNKTWLKRIQPVQSPQQRQPESDGRMTPDLFGDNFEWVQVLVVCEIVLFCGGIDVLKVFNEGCIATFCNVAK